MSVDTLLPTVTANASSELVGSDLADWLTDTVGRVLSGCDGLVTATGSAGGLESVDFWRGVVDRGPRHANPRTFPWTLASAPAGHLAAAFSIRGPVVNFVGRAEAAQAAFEAALDQLDDGTATRIGVVAFDRVDGRTSAAALVLMSLDVEEFRSVGRPDDVDASAVDALRGVIRSANEARLS